MRLEDYLDSTYLKTPKQSGLSDSETLEKVHQLTIEAIENEFYAVMIRPDYVRSVRMLIDKEKAKVKLGTVIDFPEGNGTVIEKLSEAQKAIADGADELDFVVDYKAFKKGDKEKIYEEVESCSRLGLKEGKVVKWIIETAALSDEQIIQLTQLIKEIYTEKLTLFPVENIFIKSSTGFYEAEDGKPNGANEHVIKLMLENAGPLSVKAAGGVKTKADAETMIRMGVKRIGTSSALQIASGKESKSSY